MAANINTAVGVAPRTLAEMTPGADAGNATVEETIQSLGELEKSYRDTAEQICSQHIGVYIKNISDRLPLGHRHILDVRRLVYSTMNFVLDQFEGNDAKLDELDKDELTPLHVAIATMMPDCLELLLARGADLDSEARWQSPREYYQSVRSAEIEDSIQIGGLFELHELLTYWLHQPSSTHQFNHISATWYNPSVEIGHQEFDTVDAKLGQMFEYGLWKTGSKSDADLEAKNIWFHVPCTSLPLLQVVFRTVDGIVNRNRSTIHRFPVMEVFSQSLALPAVLPYNGLLLYRTEIYEEEPAGDESLFQTSDTEIMPESSAIVFPCLVLDTVSNLQERRKIYPEWEDIGPMTSFCGTYIERTLDEAYLPSMDHEYLQARNKDQVVTKEWKRTRGTWDDNAPILIVPQIWLWKLDRVLVSSYSMTRESDIFSEVDGRHCGEFYSHSEDSPIDLQIGMILASQILEFGSGPGSKYAQRDYNFKPTLQRFEDAVISTLTEVQRYLDDASGVSNIRKQKDKERGYIHEMSDIHSELDMIQSVLEQQRTIMDAFLEDTRDKRDQALLSYPVDRAKRWASDKKSQERRMHNRAEFHQGRKYALSPQIPDAARTEAEGWRSIMKAREALDGYEKRIQKIHDRADRVEKTIESYLNLKRTYANIEDTRNSLMIGFAASAFAFVTVIFTPLSFMTSLFALPIGVFEHHKQTAALGDEGLYASSYIAGYTALAGIVTWISISVLLWLLYAYWDHKRSIRYGIWWNPFTWNRSRLAKRFDKKKISEKNLRKTSSVGIKTATSHVAGLFKRKARSSRNNLYEMDNRV